MHRHGREPLGQHGLIEGDVLDAARQQDRRAVALGEAFGHQGEPAATHLVAEVPPRKAPPIARRGVELPIGLALRRRAEAPLEQPRQRADVGQIGEAAARRGGGGSCGRHGFTHCSYVV